MKATALLAAKKAADILKKNFGKTLKVSEKEGQSLVTNIDKAAEKAIFAVLRKKYPDHNIVSEESDTVHNNSDYTWYIDPLDGTHNYIKGLHLFGVSIGLTYKEKPILGVINMPMFNEVYVAEKGKGARCNGKKIHVSKTKDVKKTFAILSFSVRRTPEHVLDTLTNMEKNVFDIRGFGCAVAGLTMVARGAADTAVMYKVHSWDVVAGNLLVEEAGGKVTYTSGLSWTADDGSFIATNKTLHKKLNELVKE